MSLNGALLRVSAGEYDAEIASNGATLVSLRYRGRHLVVPFDPRREIGRSYQGRTLVPWPNRIAGGRYTWEGEQLEVPISEPPTGAALHGHGSWHQFVVQHHFAAGVRLSLDLPATPGYPFNVLVDVVYHLHADSGLTIDIAGTNIGKRSAPFGASIHPYLNAGATVDDCQVGLPATRRLMLDDNNTPTGETSVSGTEFDLTTTTSCAGKTIDHTFTGLPEGSWSAHFTHQGHGVELSSDARWVQFFTGDQLDRLGAAVEPMTCPPDAFNQDPDVVRLEPGQRRDLGLSLRAYQA